MVDILGQIIRAVWAIMWDVRLAASLTSVVSLLDGGAPFSNCDN